MPPHSQPSFSLVVVHNSGSRILSLGLPVSGDCIAALVSSMGHSTNTATGSPSALNHFLSHSERGSA